MVGIEEAMHKQMSGLLCMIVSWHEQSWSDGNKYIVVHVTAHGSVCVCLTSNNNLRRYVFTSYQAGFIQLQSQLSKMLYQWARSRFLWTYL